MTLYGYAVNFEAVLGTVIYSEFVNRQDVMTLPLGEMNPDGVHYKNGFVGSTALDPGLHHLATLTITAQSGQPAIQVVDLAQGSPDITGFVTRCDGLGLDGHYKLEGPDTRMVQPAGDWYDADGTPVTDPIQPPTADAGGPYRGVVGQPLVLEGIGSSDPAGAPLAYSWDFGDGLTGAGPIVSHAYSVAGLFRIVLTVSNGFDSDTNTTTATIVQGFEAHVFTEGGDRTLRLGSEKPRWCVQIEAKNASFGFDVSHVDLGSIRLSYGGSDIMPIGDKTTLGGDRNRNGLEEITACFAKEDLRLLFAGLTGGEQSLDVTIAATHAGSGGPIVGTLALRVNPGGTPALAVAPHPVSPSAMATFRTSRPGSFRARLFDVRGRLVRTLEERSFAPPGLHEVRIDGRSLATGIYFVSVESAEGVFRRAITILK